MAPSRVCKSHTPLFSWGPEHLSDLHCVIVANMHTLAGSFSKPRLFSIYFPPSKACGGCFSLGIDSEVMYGKSYLNICIPLENTLVLELYLGRLSEKRVFVGPDLVTIIVNYKNAGRVVCEADKPWHCSHVEVFSKSLWALQTLEITVSYTAGLGVDKGHCPFSGWSHHDSLVE